DGLAAAPLAESLAGADGNAPILLTEANELPRATREYLIDLADEAANKTITVSIVGGKGVVSNSIKS
ncbi:cell wall-binding repeat-containing protein, partial [Acinetobacter sp. 163]|nr:cell wall-binding repeat-containing protein [Acinetobacter sp. 163]